MANLNIISDNTPEELTIPDNIISYNILIEKITKSGELPHSFSNIKLIKNYISINLNADLQIINDTIENTREHFISVDLSTKYVIFLLEHNILLKGEIYNKFMRGIDFKITHNGDKVVNFIIGYKYNYFQSIELFKWDLYEKCFIFKINN